MKCLVRRVVQLENELEDLRAGEARPRRPSELRDPKRATPAEEMARDPVRLDGLPEI